MPRTKLGGMTGAPLASSNRGKKGALTGSKHFEQPAESTPTTATTPDWQEQTQANDAKARERIKEKFSGNATPDTPNGNSPTSSTSATERAQSAIASPAANAAASLEQAKALGASFGLELIDLAGMIGGDPYKASDSIPEMSAKDANAEKLKIQRQNNALEVRLERTKQKRKVVSIATEEIRLLGDVVDYSTAGIETATKVINNQIADSKYLTQQSKLEEQNELLTQQRIRTQGTISLTPGVRVEWDLRLQKQQATNQKLQLEVEGAVNENERKREEIEALLLSD